MSGTRRVDYDAVAPQYDRRYEAPRYEDVPAALRSWIAESPGPRLFEVGCGTRYSLRMLAQDRLAIGLDSCAGMLSRARIRAPASLLLWGEASRAEP